MKKHWRRSGIGSKLLKAAEDAAKKKQVELMFAKIEASDAQSLAFYSKNGYQQKEQDKRIICFKMMSN